DETDVFFITISQLLDSRQIFRLCKANPPVQIVPVQPCIDAGQLESVVWSTPFDHQVNVPQLPILSLIESHAEIRDLSQVIAVAANYIQHRIFPQFFLSLGASSQKMNRTTIK